MGGWISVEDKIPDEGVFVLLCIEHSSGQTGYKIEPSILTGKWTGHTFKIGPNSVNINDGLPIINYWMPLPEPPVEAK